MTHEQPLSLLSDVDHLRQALTFLAKDIEGHGANPVQSALATELRTDDLVRIRAALVKLSA
jgi:hypothetical protein